MKSKAKKQTPTQDVCRQRGFHDYEEKIDSKSGGFMRCKDCGKEVDCEDPDGDLG